MNKLLKLRFVQVFKTVTPYLCFTKLFLVVQCFFGEVVLLETFEGKSSMMIYPH